MWDELLDLLFSGFKAFRKWRGGDWWLVLEDMGGGADGAITRWTQDLDSVVVLEILDEEHYLSRA